jgi:hypothetical protein
MLQILLLFQWRAVARLLMWIYRQNLPWRRIPLLFLLLGLLLGGMTAALIHHG